MNKNKCLDISENSNCDSSNNRLLWPKL